MHLNCDQLLYTKLRQKLSLRSTHVQDSMMCQTRKGKSSTQNCSCSHIRKNENPVFKSSLTKTLQNHKSYDLKHIFQLYHVNCGRNNLMNQHTLYQHIQSESRELQIHAMFPLYLPLRKSHCSNINLLALYQLQVRNFCLSQVIVLISQF